MEGLGSRLLGLLLTRLDLRGDPVQITETLGGEPASTVSILLNQLDGFKGLEHFAGNIAGAATEVRRPHTVVFVSCQKLMEFNYY